MTDDLFAVNPEWGPWTPFVPAKRWAEGYDLDVMGYPIQGQVQLLAGGDGTAALALSMLRQGADPVDIRQAVIRHRMGRNGADPDDIERAVAGMLRDTARGFYS